jgi:hypothetical protein
MNRGDLYELAKTLATIGPTEAAGDRDIRIAAVDLSLRRRGVGRSRRVTRREVEDVGELGRMLKLVLSVT